MKTNLNKVDAKRKIIDIFKNNVQGKSPDVTASNKNHDGKIGHWLEKQFGIVHNANNDADLYGFELKTDTASKTTFGDWSANRYIYKDKNYEHIFGKGKVIDKRNKFIRLFGKPNLNRGNRYSWSGQPCPKIHKFNSFGQKLVIEDNLDVLAVYSYEHDERPNKEEIIPKEFRIGIIELARWFGQSSPSNKKSDKCLKKKLEDKFNQNGWFTCKRVNGRYQRICFGEPINFENWIELLRTGDVFFDSGMYETNDRPYSQWRMNNTGWDKLIVEWSE